MIQIPLEVFNVFETNAQADEIRVGARADLLLASELAVRCGGGVNGKTAGIADIGNMAEELQSVDEFFSGL